MVGCIMELPKWTSDFMMGCCFRCHPTPKNSTEDNNSSMVRFVGPPTARCHLLLSQILPFPFRKSGTIEWHLSSRRHLKVSTHQNNLLSKTGTNSFHPTLCHMLLSKLHELFRQHVGTFWLTMSTAIFFHSFVSSVLIIGYFPEFALVSEQINLQEVNITAYGGHVPNLRIHTSPCRKSSLNWKLLSEWYLSLQYCTTLFRNQLFLLA